MGELDLSWELFGLLAVLALLVGWLAGRAQAFWKSHRRK